MFSPSAQHCVPCYRDTPVPRWGLGVSVAGHALLLLGLLARPSTPPVSAPHHVPMISVNLLVASAPPQALEQRQAREPRRETEARQQPPQPREEAAALEPPSLTPAHPLTTVSKDAAEAPSLQAPATAKTAPVRSEASQAAAPPAPSLPAGEPLNRAVQDSWQGRVLARLERFRSYPPAARARREQGVAHVLLRVNRAGQVLQAELQRSSGHAELDRAAVATMHRAVPLPAIPDELPDPLTLLVPVEFFIR